MGPWLQLIGRSAVDTVTTVTIPVAILLWVLGWLEASGRLQPSRFLAGSGWRQTVYSAAIAAVPGCAGGIAVSRLYVEGVVSPAALWAAHLATAGDASFVLLVGRPLAAIGIFAFLFVLGSVGGVMMSARRREETAAVLPPVVAGELADLGPEDQPAAGVPRLYLAWVATVCAAALAAGLANSLGVAADAVAGVLAVAAVIASVAVQRGWGTEASAQAEPRADGLACAGPVAVDAGLDVPALAVGCAPPSGPRDGADRGAAAVRSALRIAVQDASEITLWVAVADLAFYAVQQVWGPQVAAWLNGDVLPVTVIAVLVGMIPGCGPQIFLARLYTAGSLPFAAILANSVSQHGDAIFPLLARRRGQAVRVTVTSTVLAMVVGLLAVVAAAKGLG
jgi:hypothetical protein